MASELRNRVGDSNAKSPKGPNGAEGSELAVAAKVFQNTYNSSTAIAVQVGLLTVTSAIFYGLFTNPINYRFIGHPILNSLGFVFLAQALLVTQPPPISSAHKTMGGQLHGILNSISVVLYLGGSSVIFYNKTVNGANHYTTWHAWFGVATYALLFGAFIMGMSIFWMPEEVFGSVNKAKSFYKYHRMAGYLILALASITTALSLESTYNVNVLHIPYLPAVGGLVLVAGSLFSGLKLAKLGF